MGPLAFLVMYFPHDCFLQPSHLAPLEVLPVVHPAEVQRTVYHQLLHAQLRACRADHHLSNYLPIRTIQYEAEHVSWLVLSPEPQVEISDSIRPDERHRDLAHAFDVEAPAGESGSAERGGEGGVERVVSGFVEDRDGERHGGIRWRPRVPSGAWHWRRKLQGTRYGGRESR